MRVSEFNQILKHNGLEKIPESLIEESYQYNTIEIIYSEITFNSNNDNVIEVSNVNKAKKKL